MTSTPRPIELTLPWPPSANRYWRHPTKGKLAGRHLISREGRAYRDAVIWRIRRRAPLLGRLDVQFQAAPPDRRKRDLDNLLKAAQDALSHAGVWGDDGQIDRLFVERLAPVKGGVLLVRICEIIETDGETAGSVAV